MYWGQAPNKRFGHSGDNIRHLVKMGRLAGGEYRDPHFLFDFKSQTFRDLSESCCTAMLMPPMKNNMPIWNTYANVAQVFLYLFDRGILASSNVARVFLFSAKEFGRARRTRALSRMHRQRWQSTARACVE